METATKTPWHLWVIGIVATLWNAGGAYDYTMTQTRNMDYLTTGAENAGVPVETLVELLGRCDDRAGARRLPGLGA